MSLELIVGPPISGPNGMSREAAERSLKSNPAVAGDAEYKIQAHQGHWIAAVATKEAAPLTKESEFPPSDDDSGGGGGPPGGGPPSDDSGGPPSDSGGDDGSGDSGPPSDDGGDSPHKDKEKGGDKGGMHTVEQKLDLLLNALGIDPSMAGGDPMGGPMGADGGMGGPPGGGGPPGMGGPPGGDMGGPPGMGGPPPQKIMHEKALKPGEVPPGGTPMGAPSFSKVIEEHPWGHMIGKKAHFTVGPERIGNDDIRVVHDELQNLAKSGGFRLARFDPVIDEATGDRLVTATIATPQLPEQPE